MKLLIDRNGDVNSRTAGGMTALHYAALPSTAMTRLLLSSGAEIDAINSDGETALSQLIDRGISRHWARIKLLISSNASLNHRNPNGKTILDLSLSEGHLPLFRLLLDKGVDTSYLQLRQLKGKPAFVKVLQEYNIL